MESKQVDEYPTDLGLPDGSDNTLEKIACIEEMLNRMQHVSQAPDIFLQDVLGLVNKEDVTKMVEIQNHMLSRFEKTNEMLLNFNTLSMARYETTCEEFKRHTLLLTQMKKDLDNVFRRIRLLKTKLSGQYPDAFSATKMPRQLTEEDEEDEQYNNTLQNSQTNDSSSILSESSSTQSVKLRNSASVDSSKRNSQNLEQNNHTGNSVKKTDEVTEENNTISYRL